MRHDANIPAATGAAFLGGGRTHQPPINTSRVIMPLKQKRIIMTGGSGGIGRLVAAGFLREGAEVSVMSRTDPDIPQTRHLRVDLSTLDGIASASSILSDDEPDILVNLAGVQYFGLSEAQPAHDTAASYLINLVAPVALCNAALSAMKRRNLGQIVNIGSVFGALPFAHFAAYSSAKAGLRAFSEALRRELVDTDIAVTYIAPRAVRTGMITPAIRQFAEISGMRFDDPHAVSMRIISAIKHREKDVCIGLPERLFMRLNALWPRVVDRALARGDRKAKALLAS